MRGWANVAENGNAFVLTPMSGFTAEQIMTGLTAGFTAVGYSVTTEGNVLTVDVSK